MSQAAARDIGALWDALRPVALSSIASSPAMGLFENFVRTVEKPPLVDPGEPGTQPTAEQWLDVAVDAAPGPLRPLALAIANAHPHLRWLRSYENLGENPAADAFRDHYSYALLAGPSVSGTPLSYPDVLVGFTLQAPNVLYPGHHHRAPELYGVVSGRVDWRLGDGAWEPKQPGDVIVHRPHELHAMRSYGEPVLTWVIWPGDTDCHVYMPEHDPPTASMAPHVYGTH